MAREIQRTIIIQRPASTGAQAAAEISQLVGGSVALAASIGDRAEQERLRQEVEAEQIERQGFTEEIRTLADSMRDPESGTLNPDRFREAVEKRAAGKRTELNAAMFRADAAAILARDEYRQTELDEQADIFEGAALGLQVAPAIGSALQQEFDALRDDGDPNAINELAIRDRFYQEAISQGRVKTRAGQRSLYESITRSTIQEKAIRSEALRQAKIERALRQGVNVFADQVEQGAGTADLHAAVIQRREALRAIGAQDEAIVENERNYVRIVLDVAEQTGNLDLIDRAAELNNRLGTRGVPANDFNGIARRVRVKIIDGEREGREKTVNAILSEATRAGDFNRALHVWKQAAPLYDMNVEADRIAYEATQKSIFNARERWIAGKGEAVADSIDQAIAEGGGSLGAATAMKLRNAVASARELGFIRDDERAATHIAKINAAVKQRDRFEAVTTALSDALERTAAGLPHGIDLSTLPDEIVVAEFDRRLAAKAQQTGDGVSVIPPATFAENLALFQRTIGHRLPKEIMQRLEIGPGATPEDFARFATAADALRQSPGGSAFLEAHLTTDQSLAAVWLYESGVRDAEALRSLVGDAPAGAVESGMAALLGDGEDLAGILDDESGLTRSARAAFAGRFLRDYLTNWTSGAPISVVESAAKQQARRAIEQGTASTPVMGKRYTFPRYMQVGNEQVDLSILASGRYVSSAIVATVDEKWDEYEAFAGGFTWAGRYDYFQPQFDRIFLDETTGELRLPIDYIRGGAMFQDPVVRKDLFSIPVPRTASDAARLNADVLERLKSDRNGPSPRLGQ